MPCKPYHHGACWLFLVLVQTNPFQNHVFDVDEKKLAKEKERIAAELRKQKINEKEFETKFNEELEKIESVNTKNIKLDWQDEIALLILML